MTQIFLGASFADESTFVYVAERQEPNGARDTAQQPTMLPRRPREMNII